MRRCSMSVAHIARCRHECEQPSEQEQCPRPYQEACVAVRPQHALAGTGVVFEVAKVTLTASVSRARFLCWAS